MKSQDLEWVGKLMKKKFMGILSYIVSEHILRYVQASLFPQQANKKKTMRTKDRNNSKENPQLRDW